MCYYILLILGVSIALFVACRIFYTLSIFGRAIAIGLALGCLFNYMDLEFWTGAIGGVIVGLLLPILCSLIGFDYEFMEKKMRCPNCGCTRFEVKAESNGAGDFDPYFYCKKCGYKID